MKIFTDKEFERIVEKAVKKAQNEEAQKHELEHQIDLLWKEIYQMKDRLDQTCWRVSMLEPNNNKLEKNP